MQRVHPTQAHPLHHTAATRRLEHSAAATLPPHTLMGVPGWLWPSWHAPWPHMHAPYGLPAALATTAATGWKPPCCCTGQACPWW